MSKKDLDQFLDIEYFNGEGYKLIDFFIPRIKAFILFLRLTEFYTNTKGFLHPFLAKICRYKLGRYSMHLGLSIPINTCDRGLTIYHFGSIVLNHNATIGKNCCIMNNVNIGANKGSSKAPQIGDDVYIGPGAVIFGDIHIADGCYIGANAVVNKTVEEPNSVIVGVPAKVIGNESKHWWEYNRMKR